MWAVTRRGPEGRQPALIAQSTGEPVTAAIIAEALGEIQAREVSVPERAFRDLQLPIDLGWSDAISAPSGAVPGLTAIETYAERAAALHSVEGAEGELVAVGRGVVGRRPGIYRHSLGTTGLSV